MLKKIVIHFVNENNIYIDVTDSEYASIISAIAKNTVICLNSESRNYIINPNNITYVIE